MSNLHSIIMDANFYGIILEMEEEYEPITIIESEPYSPEIPLYDKSLFIIDSTLNLYLFNPPDYMEIEKTELNNIKTHIKRMYHRPITLTEGEQSTTPFTNLMLLGITPEEVYDHLTPTSIPIPKELFKIMFIQAGRYTLLNTSTLSGKTLFIKDPQTYSFHLAGLNMRQYIIKEALPVITDLLDGYTSKIASNTLLIEGSHVIYPTFKIDCDYIQIEVNKYHMLQPENTETVKMSINLPQDPTIKWFNPDKYFSSRGAYYGIAGYTLYLLSIQQDKLIQAYYNIKTGKGIKTITEEDYTYSEKIKQVQLTNNELTIDDLTFNNLRVIPTPQYALYNEEYYKRIIPEEVLEAEKSKLIKHPRVFHENFYYQRGIYYNDLFGVMIL